MSGRIIRSTTRAAERDRIARARAQASRAERYLATIRPGPTLHIFDRGERTAEIALTLPAALTLAGDILRAAGAAAAEEREG